MRQNAANVHIFSCERGFVLLRTIMHLDLVHIFGGLLMQLPYPPNTDDDLRIQRLRRILGLLDQPGHVLQEQVVHVLLVHVPQLQSLGGVAVGNGMARILVIHPV